MPVAKGLTTYRWFLEDETEILVLINQFYHRFDFFHHFEALCYFIYS